MNDCLSYPVPDPAWDYAEIWPSIWRLKEETEKLVQLLQATENASPETNAEAVNHLQAIASLQKTIRHNYIFTKDTFYH